ncbi:MAG: baseplate J/gp47 family protein [Candidatus Nanoarchaeia archaeon]|nr:baseplate J/gp47 family protein [Candidatus Nanoarchaeia archaeon]
MYPSPPTGLSVVAFSNKVEISWVKNSEPDVKGYNVYNSTTSGGGLSGYVKLNNSLIETYSEVRQEVLSSQQSVAISGATRTTTTVDQIVEVYVYKYTHENITEKKKQYYIVTAVNNVGEESVLSIEVEATPLVIPTEVVETPTRSQNDISLDYITELLERDPLLDVKPGSTIRQLHVDPNSREMSWAYIREDFAMRSQSFLALRALDDADSDGVSDSVADSTYKTILKQAYFFADDSQVQELIDDAFDALASNYGFIRQGATNSTTHIIFYTPTAPTADINIPLGEVVSTTPTETQAAIQFSTLSSGIMEVARIEEYYNSITRQYELTIPIEAVEPGATGNVNANTIINSNIAGVSVTNTESAFGGEDEESNSDLADRAQLAFLGLDVGTVYGYKKTCAQIPGIRDVIVVTAGDSMMQRDYDEVRKKHVYGKVDIYIRGGENAQTQDQVGFLYTQVVNDNFDVVDASEMIIRTTNSAVTENTPIYEVSNIRNITKGRNYDLLGNWTIKKNGTDLEKETEVTVNLETGAIAFEHALIVGDVITATYDYKIQIDDEIIIDPALGGEVDFALDHIPVAKKSYLISKNGVALEDGVDYTLNVLNGALHLYGSGLEPGDSLTASYQYIVHVLNELVLTSTGGETIANLAHGNLVESMLIGDDGLTIDLESTNEINSSISMAIGDLISSTYRYRDSAPIILATQPVDEILSVVGSVSGTLQPDINYSLNKVDDILLEGNSSKATRSVKINYANGIPVGTLASGTENLVMVNNEYRELSRYGIDTESIIVRQGTTTFFKNNDYLVTPEEDGKKVQLARSKTSTIPNGSTVEVEYSYGEILTISYQTNPLIKIAQDAIDVSRHVTADVLVKGVLETKVDFDISVVLKPTASVLQTTSDIRTALSNEFNKLKLGEGIAQSDVIRTIEEVANVKSVVVPLAKMVKADNTQINREIINSTFQVFQHNVVYSYSTGSGALLHKTLGYGAGDGFYAVFESDRPLVLVTDKNTVDNAAGQAYIGSDGEIVISTLENDLPSLHRYTVSYVVNGETGASDINATSLEYLTLGEVVITTA